MNKADFMQILGRAYNFPNYYSLNLDSADEILDDIKESSNKDKLSIKNLIYQLLDQESEEERYKIWRFLADHFQIEE